MPGGFEINWNDIVCIHVDKLRKNGRRVDIPFHYFERFAKQNLINTSDVCETLNCSRQNVDDMVKRKRLNPVQTSAKNKVFLKRDVDEKMW